MHIFRPPLLDFSCSQSSSTHFSNITADWHTASTSQPTSDFLFLSFFLSDVYLKFCNGGREANRRVLSLESISLPSALTQNSSTADQISASFSPSSSLPFVLGYFSPACELYNVANFPFYTVLWKPGWFSECCQITSLHDGTGLLHNVRRKIRMNIVLPWLWLWDHDDDYDEEEEEE